MRIPAELIDLIVDYVTRCSQDPFYGTYWVRVKRRLVRVLLKDILLELL